MLALWTVSMGPPLTCYLTPKGYLISALRQGTNGMHVTVARGHRGRKLRQRCHHPRRLELCSGCRVGISGHLSQNRKHLRDAPGLTNMIEGLSGLDCTREHPAPWRRHGHVMWTSPKWHFQALDAQPRGEGSGDYRGLDEGVRGIQEGHHGDRRRVEEDWREKNC